MVYRIKNSPLELSTPETRFETSYQAAHKCFPLHPPLLSSRSRSSPREDQLHPDRSSTNDVDKCNLISRNDSIPRHSSHLPNLLIIFTVSQKKGISLQSYPLAPSQPNKLRAIKITTIIHKRTEQKRRKKKTYRTQQPTVHELPWNGRLRTEMYGQIPQLSAMCHHGRLAAPRRHSRGQDLGVEVEELGGGNVDVGTADIEAIEVKGPSIAELLDDE